MRKEKVTSLSFLWLKCHLHAKATSLNEYYTCLVEKHHSYYIEKSALSQAIPAFFLIKSLILIFCTSKSEVMHELSTKCA